jgi:putative nucleotidyltransferase with HDIG domain
MEAPLEGPSEARARLPEWLRAALGERLRGKLALPLLPDAAARVFALCHDERSDLRELATLVQRDQTLAAHVLRVANSVAYAPKTPIVTLQAALGRLGLATVSDIAIAVAMKQCVYTVPGHELRMRALWRHSAISAGYAAEIAHLFGRNVETAFLAGLLHDVGMPLVLTVTLELHKQRRSLPDARAELEDAMSAFHCEYGAELARRWGLGPWVEAAACDHHEPASARILREDVGLVALADLLAEWADDEERAPEELEPELAAFDMLALSPAARASLLDSRARVLDLAQAFQ